MIPSLEIRTLGGLKVNLHRRPIHFEQRKTAALLIYLACTGHPHARESLSEMLWPERTQTRSLANLRVVLAELHHTLNPYIVITRDTVSMQRDMSWWLDLHAFEHAERDSAAKHPSLKAVLDHYHGDFMDGFYVDSPAFEHWLLIERERLRSMVTGILELIVREALEAHDYPTAIERAMQLLKIDPTREEFHALVMHGLAESGQQNAALEHFRLLKRLLHEDLGMQPSAELFTLADQIRDSRVMEWPQHASEKNVRHQNIERRTFPMTHDTSVHIPRPFEIGLISFVDNTPDPLTGKRISALERTQNLLEEIELADKVGLDVYGIGEHHREEYVASAPEVILAAAAARTKNIRLTSAVTVLSSDDPVRVFQRFATLDLVSNGRAEIIAGRGSFIESFPLFGYDLNDYDDLFTEKLDLLLRVREKEFVTWVGEHRPSINNLPVYPRPVQERLPIWIGVGGTPESVIRAATRGLPMALAIIGGMPERFAPLVNLYRQAYAQYNAGSNESIVSINSHGFIAGSRQEAIDVTFPGVQVMMNKIGRERGWPPLRREQYEASADVRGANFLGSPDDIIEKILFQHSLFNHQRLTLQFTVGATNHDKVLRAIELLGTKVAPVVREEIARRAEKLEPQR